MRLYTVLLFSLLYTTLMAQNSNWSEQLQTALQVQQEILPQEKIYLQTDRTLYMPGDNVWMAIYLTGSDNTTGSANSQLIHVDLLNPGGQKIQTRTIGPQNGVFNSDFALGSTLPGGVYTIRAYTNYQGNFNDKYVFEKEIQVQKSIAPKLLLKLEMEREAYGPGDTVTAFFSARDLQNKDLSEVALTYELRAGSSYKRSFTATTNAYGAVNLKAALPADLATTDVQLSVRIAHGGQNEQISRSVPVVLENISLRFLPEGGDWVAGLGCRMAFVAKNEFDEPVDVSGTIYDADEKEVVTFTSLHDGLGSIDLPPNVKTPLRARLSEPVAGKRVYPLPDPIMGIWQLAVSYQQGDMLLLKAQSFRSEELQLAIRAGGQLYDCQVWQLGNGQDELAIDVSGLPMGITQITVFDKQLRPVWERLVFLHPKQQLQVEMTTDQEQYAYRDQVDMKIQVTDERGKGVAGQFSLAVTDDQLHSFADDKQPHILAQLLLNSELRGKIHEPNFYFDPEEEDRLAALDLLLLTHGWRRFHWRELLQQQAEDWQAMRKFPYERTQLQALVLMDGVRLANASLQVEDTDDKMQVETDAYGAITFDEHPGQPGTPVTLRYNGIKTEALLGQATLIPVATHFQPGQEADKKENTLVFVTEKEEANKDQLIAIAPTNGPMDDNVWGEEQQLDEVVVTGFRQKRRSDLTGSVQIVDEMSHVRPEQGFDFALDMDMEDEIPKLAVYANNRNYQINYARVFAFPDYSNNTTRQQAGNDQRKTIYWNPQLITDQRGEAKVTFYTTDEMTTFRAIIEGIGNNQRIAHHETTLAVVPPLAIQMKMPSYAMTGDTLRIPVLITNNTDREITTPLQAEFTGQGLEWVEQLPSQVTVKANDYMQLSTTVRVSGKNDHTGIKMLAGAQNWSVEELKKLSLHRLGFPHEASTSGQQLKGNYDIDIQEPIAGTINATLRLYPDLMGQLLGGVDAMLAEPNGCFEQTSSTNYPNIMVLQYLEERQELDAATRDRANKFLQSGYTRLAGYEVNGGGFSLWGGNPADPVLSAFGLLQFNDLSKVWHKVDPKLVPRTYDWLLNAYETGQGRSTVDRAYMLYTLSEVGKYRSQSELDQLNKEAQASQTPYLLAIAARLNNRYGNNQLARQQVEQLLAGFGKDEFSTASVSPYFSHGIGSGLSTELAGWTVLAALETGVGKEEVLPLINFLMKRRQGAGRFGATQPTVMALQAITAYEKANQRPKSSGSLIVSVNQNPVDTLDYSPDSRGVLELSGLGKHFKGGNNNISIRYAGTQAPLPYSLQINWQSRQPTQQAETPLALSTQLERSSVQLNDNLRYSVQMSNRREEAGYAPMLMLSAPAGLQWQSWQLKEMKERGEIDYYEMHEPYLVLYFAEIGAQATKSLNFDLTAVVPGTYRAPSASAYLYYEDETKTWVPGEQIVIRDDVQEGE